MKGQALVQINDGEVFKSSRCNPWKVYADPAKPLTTFGDGTWKVNGQVPPGRWLSSGGPTCYWARLADLAGSIDSIAANDNTSGPAIVDIAPEDTAFTSSSCGTWSLG